MNYRQWKKNYKKRYGRNPSWLVDKRKRSKLVGEKANTFESAFNKLVEALPESIKMISRLNGKVFSTAVTIKRGDQL